MNKTAIKNYAIWARVQLINSVIGKTQYYGISDTGFKTVEWEGNACFVEGLGKRIVLSKEEVAIRQKFINKIKDLSLGSSYKEAYQVAVEEIAYTWFNRIIAIRFMEVNGYLPFHIRVLSSETAGKTDSDLMTSPLDAGLKFSQNETQLLWKLKDENRQDDLFKFLFVKQCNALSEYLPELFEKVEDYTEMMIDLKYTDHDSVVRSVVSDIDEHDFLDAVEIIGWMYQYYNTVPKQMVFDALKKNIKINKDTIPAATQLFTPHWIVRYMVENSLGKKYIDYLKTCNETFQAGKPIDYDLKIENLKKKWKYFIDTEEYENVENFDISKITIIDPCMGSGHILVYAFEVLMDIYRDLGYVEKEIPEKICKDNLFGLDIDKRAYQLAYFAIMMMARKYDRSFLRNKKVSELHLTDFAESNTLSQDLGDKLLNMRGATFTRDEADLADYIVRVFSDAMTYGSALIFEKRDYMALVDKFSKVYQSGKLDIEESGFVSDLISPISKMCKIAKLLSGEYTVACTNPPYMGGSGMDAKLSQFVKDFYPDGKSDMFAVFIEKCMELTQKNGYTAMITQHSWMFLSSFEKLRVRIINTREITSMAHLGARAFEEIGGEVVQTTTWVMRNK